MKKHILVVEDEPAIALGLEDDLTLEGYDVSVVEDGSIAVERALDSSIDLLILDVMLPGKSGYEICREVRKMRPELPILMLTAKSHEAEKVLGLELGADDYVTKPFSPLELRARIKALLRRTETGSTTLNRGGLTIDPERFEVRNGNEVIRLTPIEFRLLTALAQEAGRVLTRDQLLNLVWGEGAVVTDRSVDTHITNLRKKLGSAGHLIESIRGVGYRFGK